MSNSFFLKKREVTISSFEKLIRILKSNVVVNKNSTYLTLMLWVTVYTLMTTRIEWYISCYQCQLSKGSMKSLLLIVIIWRKLLKLDSFKNSKDTFGYRNTNMRIGIVILLLLFRSRKSEYVFISILYLVRKNWNWSLNNR